MPKLVATPFPPLNFMYIENTWPRTAAIPTVSHKKRSGGDGCVPIRFDAIMTGTAPFRTSRRKHKYAHFLPSALERFVAPILPEPTLKRSMW